MITTLLKGKRWLLKQTLLACGIESKPDDADKKYSFSAEMVEGKTIMIKVANRKNEFTGSDGNQIEKERSEVKSVKKFVQKVSAAKNPASNEKPEF